MGPRRRVLVPGKCVPVSLFPAATRGKASLPVGHAAFVKLKSNKAGTKTEKKAETRMKEHQVAKRKAEEQGGSTTVKKAKKKEAKGVLEKQKAETIVTEMFM